MAIRSLFLRIILLFSLLFPAVVKAAVTAANIPDTLKPLTIPIPAGYEKADPEAIIVVDGIITSQKKDLKSLNSLMYPHKITSIIVLDGRDASVKYGDKGKSGAIEISYKTIRSNTPVTISADPPSSRKNSLDSNLLVVLDGNIVGYLKQLESLDSLVHPFLVKEFHVISDLRATAKYGEQGNNGAIEIKTKQDEEREEALKKISPTYNKEELKDAKEAEYIGGETEYRKCLARSLNPMIPTDKGAPNGSYTVLIRFVVDTAGTVSNFKAQTNHGFGMEEEVIRVLKKCSSWKPAELNGKKLKAYRTQPVTFTVDSEAWRLFRKKKS